MPLAWVMGVDWAECGKVGELIGLKTILNEFVAYQKLSEMLKAGELSVSTIVFVTTALISAVQKKKSSECRVKVIYLFVMHL